MNRGYRRGWLLKVIVFLKEPPLLNLRPVSPALCGARRQAIFFHRGGSHRHRLRLVDVSSSSHSSSRLFGLARGQCRRGLGGKEAYYPILEALVLAGVSGVEDVSLGPDAANHSPRGLIQFSALVKPEQRRHSARNSLDHAANVWCGMNLRIIEGMAAQTPRSSSWKTFTGSMPPLSISSRRWRTSVGLLSS